MFPQVDPIPLPAPVWLFKFLEVLTVTLHFLAVQLLVGGLLFGSLWAIFGRRKADPVLCDASGALAARLPVLMTYVINLGVPPLLFLQVLYGRAIYTSSVLMGVFWIAVILLLMAAYMCLYHMSSRADKGKAWGWMGLIALVLTMKIGYIYSANMTLMLRPDVWPELYQANPLGVRMNRGDATVLPRWLFAMCGGLTVGGVGAMFLGMMTTLRAEAAEFLRRWGGRLAAAGAVVQGLVSLWVLFAQPAAVRSGLGSNWFYVLCGVLWIACTIGVAAVGFLAHTKAAARQWLWPAAAGLAVFVQTVAAVIVRGGIRDTALAQFQYDAWDRAVASNWVVVGAFLVLFVVGLGVIGWLLSVVVRMQKTEETYA